MKSAGRWHACAVSENNVHGDQVFAPKFSDPLLGWLVVIILFALEITAGVLLARGAWGMWRAVGGRGHG